MDNSELVDITAQLVADIRKPIVKAMLATTPKNFAEVSQAVLAATCFIHIVALKASNFSKEDAKSIFASAVDAQYDAD